MTRFLAIGDMHLGRVPKRLPVSWEGWKLGLPSECWMRAVGVAIERRVDAVLLAGDVIDGQSAIYAAFGPLERGVRLLKEAGIPVIAVAGNHDASLLAQFERIPGLRVLGKGASWESIRIGDACIVGWSFDTPSCTVSPLKDLPDLPDAAGSAVIGLLHCDLDAPPGSRYAPTSRTDLDSSGYAAWLLGHIHVPASLAAQPRPIGYLGSLVGLDPTETGPRGVWEVTTEGSSIQMEFAPLQALVWLTVRVDITGAASTVDMAASVHSEIEAAAAECGAAAVAVRLQFAGRVDPASFVELKTEALKLACTEFGSAWIDAVEAEDLRPAIVLADVARADDVPGLLASLILDLESGAEVAGLTEPASPGGFPAWCAGTVDTSHWRDLYGDSVPDPGFLRQLLIDVGYETLEGLLDQKPAAREAVTLEVGA